MTWLAITGVIIGSLLVIFLLIAFGVMLGILSEKKDKENKLERSIKEHEEKLRHNYRDDVKDLNG